MSAESFDANQSEEGMVGRNEIKKEAQPKLKNIIHMQRICVSSWEKQHTWKDGVHSHDPHSLFSLPGQMYWRLAV